MNQQRVRVEIFKWVLKKIAQVVSKESDYESDQNDGHTRNSGGRVRRREGEIRWRCELCGDRIQAIEQT